MKLKDCLYFVGQHLDIMQEKESSTKVSSEN